MESLNPFKLIVIVCGLTCVMLACSAPKEKQGGEENTEDATQVADSTQAEEVATTADWTQAEALVMNCGGTAMNLADPIREIADNLTRDSLMYDVKPFSDCSGTFHRVLDSLKKRCDDYPYPDKEQYRDSRLLGRWYYEQGNFIRITDPLNQGHLIKPGAVMFYGPRKGNIDSLGVESLFEQGGINHVGVVVSVEKDENGVVTGYSLFHGQRPGKYASTTNYHKREYSNRTDYPPYGNGSEQWVGVAPIISPAKSDTQANSGG